jgi:hypothetical protein
MGSGGVVDQRAAAGVSSSINGYFACAQSPNITHSDTYTNYTNADADANHTHNNNHPNDHQRNFNYLANYNNHPNDHRTYYYETYIHQAGN